MCNKPTEPFWTRFLFGKLREHLSKNHVISKAKNNKYEKYHAQDRQQRIIVFMIFAPDKDEGKFINEQSETYSVNGDDAQKESHKNEDYSIYNDEF